jgi:hypothetical protein
MGDTSFVDGVPDSFELEQSVERSAVAMDNSQYVYFIGDLASHTAEGYQCMVEAKVALSAWNSLLESLVLGDVESILTTAQCAAAQLEKTSAAPTKTGSSFGQLWATCPAKLGHVRELLAVLDCLHKGGEFPSKVRDNQLYNTTSVLKALALAMFNSNKTTAEAQLEGEDGDLKKYTFHIYSAASWAKFATLDIADTGWLRINLGAATRQASGVDVDVSVIEEIIRQQYRSC